MVALPNCKSYNIYLSVRLKTFDVNKYISETNTTFTEEEIKRLISDQTRLNK